MPIVVDGYNLAWALGETGRLLQKGDLAAARDRLLLLLSQRLGDRRHQTTVVFDARQPPPDLPLATSAHGIRVRFAVQQASADELIIQIIADSSAPRHLLVVSSDREIRSAARHHGATAIGVGAFLGKLGLSTRSGTRAGRRAGRAPAPPPDDKPADTSGNDYWWRQFEHVADTPGLDQITGPGELQSPDDPHREDPHG